MIRGLGKQAEGGNLLDRWKTVFVPFATEVLETTASLDCIEKKYFDGHPILWKSSRGQLEQFQKGLRELLDLYHLHLEKRAGLGAPHLDRRAKKSTVSILMRSLD